MFYNNVCKSQFEVGRMYMGEHVWETAGLIKEKMANATDKGNKTKSSSSKALMECQMFMALLNKSKVRTIQILGSEDLIPEGRHCHKEGLLLGFWGLIKESQSMPTLQD